METQVQILKPLYKQMTAIIPTGPDYLKVLKDDYAFLKLDQLLAPSNSCGKGRYAWDILLLMNQHLPEVLDFRNPKSVEPPAELITELRAMISVSESSNMLEFLLQAAAVSIGFARGSLFCAVVAILQNGNTQAQEVLEKFFRWLELVTLCLSVGDRHTKRCIIAIDLIVEALMATKVGGSNLGELLKQPVQKITFAWHDLIPDEACHLSKVASQVFPSPRQGHLLGATRQLVDASSGGRCIYPKHQELLGYLYELCPSRLVSPVIAGLDRLEKAAQLLGVADDNTGAKSVITAYCEAWEQKLHQDLKHLLQLIEMDPEGAKESAEQALQTWLSVVNERLDELGRIQQECLAEVENVTSGHSSALDELLPRVSRFEARLTALTQGIEDSRHALESEDGLSSVEAEATVLKEEFEKLIATIKRSTEAPLITAQPEFVTSTMQTLDNLEQSFERLEQRVQAISQSVAQETADSIALQAFAINQACLN